MHDENTVRVCIVGLGYWGPNFVRSLERIPTAKVMCGVERSAQQRDVIGDKLPKLEVFEDFETCLSEVEFDAVIISTPTEYHFACALTAIKAGKHVLVEKPLTHSSESAEKLVGAAKDHRVILMTGHTFLFNAAIIEAKRIIDNQDLGRILYLRSLRTNLGPIRSDVNAMWDLASHDIAIFNYLLDAVPIEARSNQFPVLGLAQEDLVQAALVYPQGRVALLFASWVDPQKQREITVVGDSKMLVFDDMKPSCPLSLFDSGVKVEQPPAYYDTFESFRALIRVGPVCEPNVITGEPLKNECEHFIESILNKRPPRSDGQFGSNVIKVLEALEQSKLQGGSAVKIEWGRNEGSIC